MIYARVGSPYSWLSALKIHQRSSKFSFKLPILQYKNITEVLLIKYFTPALRLGCESFSCCFSSHQHYCLGLPLLPKQSFVRQINANGTQGVYAFSRYSHHDCLLDQLFESIQ